MNVVMIGAGMMGSQIGCEYALGGHTVWFVARRRDAAEDRVEQALGLAERSALAAALDIEQALHRIAIVGDLDSVDQAVDLVVESIVEDFDAKAEVLQAAADRWPGSIVATNTSSLSVTRLGEAANAAARIVGTHYWNPPLLMPLVEVVRGEGTEPSVVDRITTVLHALGKRPVLVEDVPGFVWNRLQLALLREAAWIVEHGVATPEAVDEIVRDGLARRWRWTGPFQTVALGGPSTFTRIAANLFPVLSDATELENIARWLETDADELGRLRARRDAGLLADLRRERIEHSAGKSAD